MAKAINTVISLKDRFSLPLRGIAEKLGTTEAKLKKANIQITKFQNNAVSGFKNASAAIAGVGASVVGIVGLMTKTTLSYAKEVKTMQRLTGASVEEASKMVAIGKRYGVSAEGMSKAIRMLGIKAVNGGKDFKKYGLTVKDAHGQLLPASKILENVADKYKQLGGGLNGAVFAQKIMGKSAMSLIPLLEKGSAGVRDMYEQAEKMGLVLTNDNMRAFEKFSKVQKNFNQAMLGIQVTIGTKVLPSLSMLAEKAQVVIQKIDFKQIGDYTTQALKAIGNAAIFVSQNLNWIIPIAGRLLGTFVAFSVVNSIATAMTSFATVLGAVKTMGGLSNIILMRSATLQSINTIRTNAATAAQWLYNAALNANPIGLVVLRIAAVIGVAVLLIKNVKNITNAFMQAWEWITKVGKGLLGIKDKSVNVNVTKTENGGTGKPPRHALGTSYFQGGKTRMNEGGRDEMAVLPSGSQIVPANETKKAMGGGSKIDLGGIHIAGNVIGNESFLNDLVENFARKLTLELAKAY